MLLWRLQTRLSALGWTKKQTPTVVPLESSSELRITMVGHSTLLIQVEGLNIITDPIYSTSAGPYGFFGPARVHKPGIRFEDLPPIDYVIVSHNHYDHLDLPTISRLDKRHRPAYIVPLGIKPFLKENGIVGDIIELDWWARHTVTKNISITAVPAQHWSRRTLNDTNKTLWMGAVISTPLHMIYFAGDTAWGPHFEQISARLGRPTVSLLPIGAYKPYELVAHCHISPEEAVRAHRALDSHLSIPIHFDTFPLAGEKYGEATVDLKRAMSAQGLASDAFMILPIGDSYVAHSENVIAERSKSHPLSK